MRYIVLLLILVIGSSCSVNRGASRDGGPGKDLVAIWRASRSEGDKPGIGIELRFGGKGVDGTYYLMDPSDPSNFRRGRAVKMKTISEDRKRLVFSVRIPGKQEWQFAIRFDQPLAGECAKAMMEWTHTFELPLEFRPMSAMIK